MCGISGFLAPPSQSHDELVRVVTNMSDCLRHRGPDDAASWVDPAAGIAFGFRRLAIIDLSEHGRQPMISASGRFIIELNGEIYNFLELRRQLEQQGHAFRGHSDVEVALAVIERDGLAAALAEFDGMFALALWDRQTRTLALARDRFGEKPLYYGWSGRTFMFASELKALRQHPAFTAEIDRDAVAAYFRLSYVPSPQSVYRGIHKVPAGTFVEVRQDHETVGQDPTPQPYWSAAEVAQHGAQDPFTGTEVEAATELERLLRRSVSLRMLSDVPLGAFLSGGIDSSVIVAMMQVQSTKPVRTFTIGFDERGHDEAKDAKAVAARLGTDHTELYVRPEDARAVIPRLPQLYDEPFADSSQIPTFIVASLARRHVTVALSGDGGDELFGGYNRYAWLNRIWGRVGWIPQSARRMGGRALLAAGPDGWDRAFSAAGVLVPPRWRVRNPGEKLHKLGSVIGASSAPALYDALVSIWRDPGDVVLGAAAGVRNSAGSDPPFADVRQWMMYRDTVTYLPDDILVKVDRATMGASLEARVPFLDPAVYAFAWRLPMTFKIRDDRGKWILRRLLERHMPRDMFERPKMGFAVPVGAWLRGPLRDWANDLLDERRLRREGYVSAAPIRALWQAHATGNTDGERRLWTALMFEAWLADNPV